MIIQILLAWLGLFICNAEANSSGWEEMFNKLLEKCIKEDKLIHSQALGQITRQNLKLLEKSKVSLEKLSDSKCNSDPRKVHLLHIGKDDDTVEVSIVNMKTARKLFNKIKEATYITFNEPRTGCFARAYEISMLFEQLGFQTAHAMPFGRLKVSIDGKDQKWGYHFAPILMIEEGGKLIPYIFDPFLFNGPASLDELVKKITAHHKQNCEFKFLNQKPSIPIFHLPFIVKDGDSFKTFNLDRFGGIEERKLKKFDFSSSSLGQFSFGGKNTYNLSKEQCDFIQKQGGTIHPKYRLYITNRYTSSMEMVSRGKFLKNWNLDVLINNKCVLKSADLLLGKN